MDQHRQRAAGSLNRAEIDRTPSLGGSGWRRGGISARVAGIAALIVMAAALLTFAGLLDDVVRTSGVAVSDLAKVQALSTTRGPSSQAMMRIVTAAGGPVVMSLAAAAVCGWLAWRRRTVEPLVLGVVAVSGIAVLDTTTKYMVGRSRPPLALHAVAVDGQSFPSGHASFSAVVIPLCCALVTRYAMRRTLWRVVLWLCSLFMIVTVGFSRVFLGVHYPTDVLAGWSLAAAWDAVIVLALVIVPVPRPGGLGRDRTAAAATSLVRGV